ncbi:MAG: hypothetical protein PHV97_01820 [Candidatus Omnitrophica bacterium]|nr:hypothetical protein [Candidatus Omnitrophota bacterium]
MDKKGIRSKYLVRVTSVFIFFFLAVASGWALDDDPSQNTVTGRVEDIDSLKSMITVRYPDPDTGVEHEIDVFVPEETKIMNGSEEITFLDIEQFDPVTVTYSGDGVSGLKAKEILELNPVDQ